MGPGAAGGGQLTMISGGGTNYVQVASYTLYQIYLEIFLMVNGGTGLQALVPLLVNTNEIFSFNPMLLHLDHCLLDNMGLPSYFHSKHFLPISTARQQPNLAPKHFFLFN